MASFRQDKKGKEQRERITGTIKYMALELLKAIKKKENTLKQTYRHDLGSFFYVLTVGCMSYGRESAPEHLHQWSSASTRLEAKGYHIQTQFRKYIINYFTPMFEGIKELAWSLREILFEDKWMGCGTPKEPDVLYDPIIRAFDDTIKKLEDGKVFN
ncbi:unnamed protein product [Blumeria hordei]|uniref:Fungal-type protein kinase domain-containing protein n=1 Tax=Blumeria hordei TaxID=2867405 RepID=A0A383UNQ7_BLUHO|nr:unnamed protein product [Blumeria hordei]